MMDQLLSICLQLFMADDALQFTIAKLLLHYTINQFACGIHCPQHTMITEGYGIKCSAQEICAHSYRKVTAIKLNVCAVFRLGLCYVCVTFPMWYTSPYHYVPDGLSCFEHSQRHPVYGDRAEDTGLALQPSGFNMSLCYSNYHHVLDMLDYVEYINSSIHHQHVAAWPKQFISAASGQTSHIY